MSKIGLSAVEDVKKMSSQESQRVYPPSKQPSPLQSDQSNVRSAQIVQQEEEEKIFKALSTCYDDYLKGNKILMSKIVNEMTNRHKDKEHIRIWLKASTKKLIDLFKNRQDVNYMIEVILYHMPWFEAGNEYEIGLQEQEQKKMQSQLHPGQEITDHILSHAVTIHPIGSSTSLFSNCSNTPKTMPKPVIKRPSPHFELFSELSKFIMTILSFNNAFAPQIIKFLISNMVPMEIKEMDGCKKSEIEITVEGVVFDNQKKLLMFIRDTLNKYVLNSISDVQELTKQDSNFLLGVLKYHPNVKEKMNKFKKLIIGQAQFDDKISRCLYILNKDSQKIDISYVKSVQNLVDEQFQKIGLKQGSPNQKQMMLQLIDLLAKIIKIYPLYQNELCRIIQESYPHRIQGQQFHKIYLTNALQLANKYPMIMPKILMIVVHKLLEIDSEIKLDYFEGQNIEKTSQIMAEKLDWLMLIIFEFLDYQLKDKGGEDSCFGEIQSKINDKNCEQNEEVLFKTLLSVFSEQILITHQSKYVQFMMFYLCSLRQNYQNMFLNQLMTNIIKKDPLLYNSTKINSIYYLGSYLARAKYVTNDSIQRIFNFLIDYLNKYIQKFDERQKEDNYNEGLHKIHQNMYHLLQAMLYILCFRFKAISDDILEAFFQLMRQACANFNALFFISPNIKIVFKNVCSSFGKKEFSELFQPPPDEQTPAQAAAIAQQNHAQSLESYFPFDPYCLQYSDKYICEIYQNWQELQIQEIDEYDNIDITDTEEKKLRKSEKGLKKDKSVNKQEANVNINVKGLNSSFSVNNLALNSSRNYGFTIDKLNNINDIEYDRENMIEDEDDAKCTLGRTFLEALNSDDSDENNLQKQIHAADKKAKLNGVGNKHSQRRNPISTTDNSVNNTPLTNNDDDSSNPQSAHSRNGKRKSKSHKLISPPVHNDVDNINNFSFGHKKMQNNQQSNHE